MSLWSQPIKPMLAHISEPFDDNSFLYEIKFDGTRAICYIDTKAKSVKLLNRRMIYFENRYPELKELWRDVDGKQVILDAEVVVFDKGKPNFYKLAEREHLDDPIRIELLSKISPATLIVFDILHKDGKDLINLPLSERKKILKQTVKESERVLLSTYVIGSGRKFFKEVVRRALEGMMAKKLNSPYRIGERSNDWLKIKSLQTLDVIIIGYSSGTGKRGELLGSLISACYYRRKLKYTGKIGTGFTEEQLRELLQKLEKIKTEKCPIKPEPELKLPSERKPIWTKPKLVCEVKFMNLSKDLIMRAPSFIRLREDKAPEDCILEI